MLFSKKYDLFSAITASRFTLSCTAGFLLMTPAAVMALCTDTSSAASATAGSVCQATHTAYSGLTTTLSAQGNGSILTATGLSSLHTTNNNLTSPVLAHGIAASNGGQVNVTAQNGLLTIGVLGQSSTGINSTGADSAVTVNGSVNITTGGGHGGYEYSSGLYAGNGGRITIHGSADITTGTAGGTGTGNTGIMASGTNAQITIDGDVKIRPANTTGSAGISATSNASINVGNVDILISGPSQFNTYGILADVGTSVTIAGGTVVEKSLGSGVSNTALRASSGVLNVTGYLSITTEGVGARGVYTSNTGTINLTDTDIHIVKGDWGQKSPAIQAGKSRIGATGPGVVNSTGTMHILQELTDAPALYVEEQSQINANYASSSTTIDAAGTAIIYGASDLSTYQETLATIALNNATITTRSADADLIKVGGRVLSGSSLSLTNGTAIASDGGWLLSVTDTVITDSFVNGSLVRSSNFVFNADHMQLKGNVNTVTGSTLAMSLTNGSTWTLAQNSGNNISTLTSLTLDHSTIDASGGDYVIAGNINASNSVMDLSGISANAGNTLCIQGNYTATDGTIILDTVLGNDRSPSDRIILDGGAATGDNTLIIRNQGGQGAPTESNGILVVETINGATTSASGFRLGNRLVAGAYDYDLYQGGMGANATDGNWYLRTLSDASGKPAPRAETGVYLRNQSIASTMFMHTLHDRLGEPQFANAYKDGGNAPSVWVRVAGNHTEGKAANGQINLDTDTTLVQLGGDLARWSSNGNDRMHVGLMGAYGRSDTDADAQPLYTSYGYKRTASGKVEGYSVGTYFTWYGNSDQASGPYIDTWAQYAWYDNKVQGNGQKEESYDSTGWTVSVEGGYAFIAGETENRLWMIEPQAQLAYNRYSADDHREANGTWVRNGDADGVIARLGARFYSRGKLNDNAIQPFVETNWWYGNAKNSLRFNGTELSEDTPDNRFELKAGLQGEIARGWQAWGHIGGQWGENSYSRYEGMIGVKHMF